MTKRQPVISLAVSVKENVTTTDKMHTYKRWFNGMKHFYTAKVLPPKP